MSRGVYCESLSAHGVWGVACWWRTRHNKQRLARQNQAEFSSRELLDCPRLLAQSPYVCPEPLVLRPQDRHHPRMGLELISGPDHGDETTLANKRVSHEHNGHEDKQEPCRPASGAGAAASRGDRWPDGVFGLKLRHGWFVRAALEYRTSSKSNKSFPRPAVSLSHSPPEYK